MVAALLAELFESHRAHLLSVAYRMTGSVGDAEDAVQESWLRLAGVHQSEVEDLRAWLTVAVSRICVEHLRTAATRRESYVGQWLPEPVVTGTAPAPFPDPFALITRDPRCRMAELVALDALTPEQRVSYVLYEGLSLPFEEVAEILGISVRGAWAGVTRAREVLAAVALPVSDTEHETAVRRLLLALASGELFRVVAALHRDAVLIGDANGTTSTAVNIVGGAESVARFMLALVHRYGLGDTEDAATRYRFATVNGQLGVVMNSDAEIFEQAWYPARVIGFTVRDGSVWGTYDHANPAKLSGVRL
ncbi:RNA polymerase sigma factor SigJ [Nocardia takedensis]|uniref:RNA polymerase sigma factor SigJ n=1 Tax=Nocardia takedensis TaxID=259390 RepID=UPI0002DF46FB|nr:RNA polymerase sigma factor SigJ [Nocardia takedensis]